MSITQQTIDEQMQKYNTASNAQHGNNLFCILTGLNLELNDVDDGWCGVKNSKSVLENHMAGLGSLFQQKQPGKLVQKLQQIRQQLAEIMNAPPPAGAPVGEGSSHSSRVSATQSDFTLGA